MSPEQRQLVWEGLLNADFLARYYGRLASRYENRERVIAYTAAILSSGALFNLLTDSPLAWVTEALSFVVVVLSLYLGFARIGRIAMLASWQHAKWVRLESGYERLWKRLPELSPKRAEQEWWALAESSREGSATMPIEFPEKKRLAIQCQREVKLARAGQRAERTPSASAPAGAASA